LRCGWRGCGDGSDQGEGGGDALDQRSGAHCGMDTWDIAHCAWNNGHGLGELLADGFEPFAVTETPVPVHLNALNAAPSVTIWLRRVVERFVMVGAAGQQSQQLQQGTFRRIEQSLFWDARARRWLPRDAPADQDTHG
jgi:hypothetical protein